LSPAADKGVNSSDFFQRGCSASANRPDRLIGNYDSLGRSALWQGAVNLLSYHCFCLPSISFRLSFTDTYDGHQARFQGGFSFAFDLFTGFAVISPPL
jgi:hypothetical protein